LNIVDFGGKKKKYKTDKYIRTGVKKMNKIKMGWSEADLTPQGRTVELAGQFY